MDLMPTRCPKCGDKMSTPVPGRRTGLLMSSCRACGYTERSATPLVADAFKPSAEPAHGAMFLPSTSAPEPPPVKPGAMARFDRAAVGGTLRKEIQRNRRQVAEAASIDPKLKQLGEVDR